MNRLAKFYDRPTEDVAPVKSDAPVDSRYIERLKQTIRSLEKERDDARAANQTLCAKLQEREQLRQRADASGAECARLERQQERADRYHEKVVVGMGSVIFMLATLVFAMGGVIYRMGM